MDDPLEKGMATHSSILAREFHGQRSLGAGGWLQSTGSQRVRRSWRDWTNMHVVLRTGQRWDPSWAWGPLSAVCSVEGGSLSGEPEHAAGANKWWPCLYLKDCSFVCDRYFCINSYFLKYCMNILLVLMTAVLVPLKFYTRGKYLSHLSLVLNKSLSLNFSLNRNQPFT